MENTNSFNPSLISKNALDYIITRRGYSDRNTLELLNKTVQHYASKGKYVESVIKDICLQLSFLTNITFEDWIDHLYPTNYDSYKTLRLMLDRLQIYTPKAIKDEISSLNIPIMSPLDSYRNLCCIDDRINSDNVTLRWGLLAQFSDRGCIYSMLSLAHLMCPLSKNDPVIGPNTNIGHQLFSYSISEIEIAKDDNLMHHFTSRFQCMVSEAYLKHGLFLATTKYHVKGLDMIKYAYKIAPKYSRTKRYIQKNNPELIINFNELN